MIDYRGQLKHSGHFHSDIRAVLLFRILKKMWYIYDWEGFINQIQIDSRKVECVWVSIWKSLDCEASMFVLN